MAEQLNEWGKADLIVPDFLKDVRDGVNEVAEFLLTVLNIANDVLDLIKNFVFDFAVAWAAHACIFYKNSFS